MDRTAFAIISAGATFFLGTFASFFLPFPNGPWINLVWGVVDGLGPFAIDKVHPGTNLLRGPVPSAVILWPWVVAVLTFLAIRFKVRSKRIGWTHPAAIFVITSVLVCVPYKPVENALKANDPTWLSYYYAGY